MNIILSIYTSTCIWTPGVVRKKKGQPFDGQFVVVCPEFCLWCIYEDTKVTLVDVQVIHIKSIGWTIGGEISINLWNIFTLPVLK